MKDGRWRVCSWNNKDATLIHEDGTFESVTKSDLCKEFGGILYVGETVIVTTIKTMLPEFSTPDDRMHSVHEHRSREEKRLSKERV